MKFVRKKLLDLSPITIKEIGTLLDENYSGVFHEPDFHRIVEEIYNTEFSYNLVYNSRGRLIALCPLHAIRNGILSRTYSNPTIYEVPYGGWVYNRNEVSLLELFNQMKLFFNESLTYWSLPQVGNNDYPQIKHKKQFQTSIIDLEVSEDTIWRSSINSKRRNMIRKAQRNNILIEKLDYKKFEVYYKLMKETYQYAGLKIKPKEYYCKILETYVPNCRATIMLAKKDNAVISGLLLLRNKHICHYWLGATKKGTENLGQGELLQWKAIKWAKETGSRYYDLCVVEPERLSNIARFKLGFSKRIVPFYCISKRKIGYRIFTRILRCS